MYDVPTFVQNRTPPWIALVDLPQIDSVDYHAFNVIMSVAGRDADGPSRLLFIEVEAARIHRNIEHQGNPTIVIVGDDGGMTIVADSGGNIDILAGGDWTVNVSRLLFKISSLILISPRTVNMPFWGWSQA